MATGEVCFKAIETRLKMQDTGTGSFEGLCLSYGNIDRQNDIIERGSVKNLATFPQAGYVLWNHDPKMEVATIDAAIDTADGVVVRGTFFPDEAAQTLRKRLTTRQARGKTIEMSIGFHCHESEPCRRTRARRIKSLSLFETSILTGIPAANPMALVGNIKSGGTMSALAIQHLPPSRGCSPGGALVWSSEYLNRKSIIGLAVDIKQVDFGTVGSGAMVAQPGRPVTVLDLIREEPVTDTSINYAIFTLGDIAAPVTSGALKPAITATVATGNAPVETIPAWIRTTRQAIDDSEQLRAAIDTGLGAAIRRAEEMQVLNGTGVPPQLKGILTTAGLLPITATTLPDAALEGQTLIAGQGFVADGVVVNPTDWRTYRGGASGSKGFDEMFGRLWGMTVIVTKSIAAGTLLVGAFAVGDVIYRRSGVRIIVGTTGTDLVENKLIILGESRLANACVLPTAFARGTLA
jgi:Phage capsid family/Caudovirus prohead serine protease